MKFLGSDIQRTLDLASAFSGNGPVDPLDLTATGPAAPAAGATRLFRRAIANRQMPAFIGPTGPESALQPLLARNRICFWLASGSNNAVSSLGYQTIATSGTTTGRPVSAASVLGRMRRVGFVSTAGAASFASMRVTLAMITTGTTIGGIAVGGFFKVIRFAISDAVAVPGARMFVGIQASVAAPSNVEPSTLTDCIGLGHGAADGNLRLFYGGSVAQAPVDLGPSFPNTPGTAYELALYCAPGSAEVSWQVSRLDAIVTPASGTIAGSAGTNLPASTTLLTYSWNWRCTNASTLAVGLDLLSDYVETDQ